MNKLVCSDISYIYECSNPIVPRSLISCVTLLSCRWPRCFSLKPLHNDPGSISIPFLFQYLDCPMFYWFRDVTDPHSFWRSVSARDKKQTNLDFKLLRIERIKTPYALFTQRCRLFTHDLWKPANCCLA